MDRLCRGLLILAVLLVAYSVVVLTLRTSCVMVAVAALGVGALVSRRQPPSSHGTYGTAHWCTEDQARKAGML